MIYVVTNSYCKNKAVTAKIRVFNSVKAICSHVVTAFTTFLTEYIYTHTHAHAHAYILVK
jgi:hypothetical protein